MNRRRVVPAIAGSLALVLLVALYLVLRPGSGQMHASADFSRTVGLFKGSDVRILGVKVGEVTGVHPQGTTVRVDFTYDKKYKVPADAKAVIVSPSVVSDRYVQLTPVWRHGAALGAGAEIPLDRTAVPVELDRVYQSLDDLDVALGPQGANKSGALSRLLAVGADNLGGEGDQLNGTVHDLATVLSTLSDGRDDLFGTVRNLQVFTSMLANSDTQVRGFNQNLASVADQLAGERQELGAALSNLAVALSEVARFVHDNRGDLSADLKGLNDVAAVLAKQKAALGEVLRDGPAALSNLQLAYNPASGTLDTRNNAQQSQDPALFLCSLLVTTGQPPSICDQLKKIFAALPPLTPPASSGPAALPDLTLGGILPGATP